MSDIADGGPSDADFYAEIPHALPPDSELVGRDAELASLRDFIQKHQATFRRLHTSVQVCITGVAGVGKSALATRLAYDLADSYQGGALYLNLRDSQETGDLDISQVLRRFLRQLGQNPDKLRPSADLADEYQRATKNKQLIVYLDNVLDYDSIEVLVPRTSTCLVILTSLRRLTDDIRPLPLDKLDERDAVELFGLIAPDRVGPGSQSDGELARVLEACAGLPIAIRALAARLQEEPGYSFAQVLEDLANSQYTAVFGLELDRIYSRCFGVGYAALTELQARLFRALSVVPGESFNVATAARLAGGLPADKARAHLEKLLALQLIQRTKDHDYFTMHSLLRKFGQERLGAGVMDQLTQVLRVYCAEAKENDELIRSLRPASSLSRPGPGGRVERISREREKALEWMKKQLHNLVAAVLAACSEQQTDADRHSGDKEYAEIAWQLCCAMVEFFEIRGEWEAWQQTHEEAEKIVERDSVGHAFVAYGLGRYYGSRRQWQEAIGYYRTAIAIFRVHGRDDEVGRCLNYLGDVYRYMRNWDAAENCFTRILNLTHSPRQVAVAKRSMAAICRLRGQFREAADYCTEAIEILESLHDERWIAATKLSLADIYLDSDDDPSSDLNEPAGLPLARALLEDCLEVFQIFDDTHWLILSRRSLGEALRKQGDFIGALRQLARCEESLQNTHDSQWQGQVLHSIGLVYLDQADLDAARTAFDQAKSMFQKAKDTLWEGRTYVSIAHVEEKNQAFGKALAHCMTAWPLLVEQGADADLRRLEDDLTELQRRLGEAGQAPEVA